MVLCYSSPHRLRQCSLFQFPALVFCPCSPGFSVAPNSPSRQSKDALARMPALPSCGQGKGRPGGDFRFHARKWRRCAAWEGEQSWKWGEESSPSSLARTGMRKEQMAKHHLRTTSHCPGSVGCGRQACVQGIKEARQARISPARTRRSDLNGHHHRAAKLLSTSDINVDSLTCMLFPVSSLFLMMFAVLRVYNFC